MSLGPTSSERPENGGSACSRSRMGPRASVVIPTRGRVRLLNRCLAAVIGQDLEVSVYEVIVVNDGPDAGVRREVERCAEMALERNLAVRYLSLPAPRGPAAARNVGWRAAQGEIIAFTDDDCVPESSWLRAGLDAFVDGVVGASGMTLVPLPSHPTDYELNAAQLERSEFVTANCFYRRQALAAVGGFDERFTSAWREDTDVYFSLVTNRARLAHAPEAVVVHPARPASWGISLRQQHKSLFNALLYKKHPDLYRERVQSKPPWHYYCIVAALVAAASGAGGRSRRLAIGAAVFWIVATGRLCARRLHGASRSPSHVMEMAVTSALIPLLAVMWRIAGAIKFRVFFL